jgi:hypothetical protein
MKHLRSQAKKWHAPDWKDSEAYGDVASWSDRRWAWEFLRRNAAYQDIRTVGGPPSVQLKVGREFGRAKVRPYWSEYSTEEERDDVWLFDRVIVEQGWDGFDTKPQTPLATTEIAIKLDLFVAMSSGEAARNILVEKIKLLLDEQMADRWGEDGFPDRATRRPSNSELFQYLRLVDAGNTSALELAPFLYPEYCTASKIADRVLVTCGASNISRQRNRAKMMVNGGYLCLVPKPAK